MSRARRARVRALAKINLDLRVLGKRPDGYHELRTIFQTISLADTIDIAFTPAAKTAIALEDALGIPDNLVERAARLALEAMRVTGRVEMRLEKRIPMGAGLGGGSSDAAAVLLALPVLAGRPLDVPRLLRAGGRNWAAMFRSFCWAAPRWASDAAPSCSRLPDGPARHGRAGGAGSPCFDTAEAYRDLSPRLTTESQQNKIFSFQSHAWELGCLEPAVNDFEAVVFEQHARLAALKRRLSRTGASVALMTGSGSAIFGLFPNRGAALDALEVLEDEKAVPISLVSRARYRGIWWRALGEHITGNIWPPRSRYER